MNTKVPRNKSLPFINQKMKQSIGANSERDLRIEGSSPEGRVYSQGLHFSCRAACVSVRFRTNWEGQILHFG